jgi:hypothetical protein
MKKLLIALVMLSFTTLASAQDGKKFLTRFESFVTTIEKSKTIEPQKWDSLNTDYKAFRDEYKTKYKKTLDDEDLKKYNELKARYIRQVSVKKVGGSLKKKAKSVEGLFRGTFGN